MQGFITAQEVEVQIMTQACYPACGFGGFGNIENLLVILLGSFFSFLFLLALESIHVALEKVAVGKLELVHLLGVNNSGNFLILENSSHETHVLRWVRVWC